MSIKLEEIKKLPDTPGVYFFKRGREILYIGKATSLRDRVKSYLSKDLLRTRSMLIGDMVLLADNVAYQESDSVLEALILEAELIKKYQPHYNSREKDDKSFNFVVITDEEYPAVFTIRARDLEHQKIVKEFKIKYQFGPFTQGGMLQEALRIVRRIFPFRDQKCISAYIQKEYGIDPPKPCFCRQIGLCPGVCTGEISKKEYGRTIQNIRLFFEGRKGELIRKLKSEMKECAKELEFERADDIKKQIFSLEHIKDSSLIKEEFKSESFESENGPANPSGGFRIEAYDIAHMSGKSMTGVMVVVENGKAKKADYRMFRIRGKYGKKKSQETGGGDVGSLKEVLNRRLNHPEWPYPNLIVLDGGVAQLNMGKELLKKRGFDISVVAVTKNEQHRPKMIIGEKLKIEKREKEILLSNSEAHRFTLKYHRKLRGRQMFEN